MITANIVAYMEEARIGGCIESLSPIVDDIVVVDQGSTDDTVTVAREMGATVFVDPPAGCPERSRPLAEHHSPGPWILSVDCDERPTPMFADRIGPLTAMGVECVALIRENRIGGRLWNREQHLRLYRKHFVSWTPALHTRPSPVQEARWWRDEDYVAILHDKTWAEQFVDDALYTARGFHCWLYDLAEGRGLTGGDLDAMSVEDQIRLGFDW